MSSELATWCAKMNEDYFTIQAHNLDDSLKLSQHRRLKPSFQTTVSAFSGEKGSSTFPMQFQISKKKKALRAKVYGYSMCVNPKVSLNFFQLEKCDRIEESSKHKEANRNAAPRKYKGIIDWSTDVDQILNVYRNSFTYLRSRLGRSDKRELLRIAQEVQMANRVRRTCLPILKSPHSFLFPPPAPKDVNKQTQKSPTPTDIKKSENTKPIASAQSSNATPPPPPPQRVEAPKVYISPPSAMNLFNPPPYVPVQTKKRKPTNKDAMKREYFQVKTINLSLEESLSRQRKPLLPMVQRIKSHPQTNLDDKNLNANDKSNKIAKISMNRDEFRLTTKKKDGKYEHINVLLSPTILSMNSGDQRYDDDRMFNSSVVVSTLSGTSFHMNNSVPVIRSQKSTYFDSNFLK